MLVLRTLIGARDAERTARLRTFLRDASSLNRSTAVRELLAVADPLGVPDALAELVAALRAGASRPDDRDVGEYAARCGTASDVPAFEAVVQLRAAACERERGELAAGGSLDVRVARMLRGGVAHSDRVVAQLRADLEALRARTGVRGGAREA
jgi:hypothetical protein